MRSDDKRQNPRGIGRRPLPVSSGLVCGEHPDTFYFDGARRAHTRLKFTGLQDAQQRAVACAELAISSRKQRAAIGQFETPTRDRSSRR